MCEYEILMDLRTLEQVFITSIYSPGCKCNLLSTRRSALILVGKWRVGKKRRRVSESLGIRESTGETGGDIGLCVESRRNKRSRSARGFVNTSDEESGSFSNTQPLVSAEWEDFSNHRSLRKDHYCVLMPYLCLHNADVLHRHGCEMLLRNLYLPAISKWTAACVMHVTFQFGKKIQ